MSARQRLTFAGIAAAIAVLAIVVLALGGGAEDDPVTATATPTPQATQAAEATATATATPEPEPRIPVIDARDGQPVGGVEELRFEEGEEIVFAVRSDVDEEVHVHGYDVTRPLPAGKRVRFAFPAEITGVFEVELHGTGTQVASLTVEP